MDYRVISIGTTARNELWGESQDVRTAHATTVLVRSADRVILVDPGLPGPVVAARLAERAGLEPSAVTDVFCTNFRPVRRRGLSAFEHANWLISEMERESIGQQLVETLNRAEDAEVRDLIKQEIAILKRFKPAQDRLVAQVDLFPLPGPTPGNCGLLLSLLNSTILIAGDAVPTVEHLEQGRIPRDCADAEQAQESFMEAVEIADVIIPGYDNVILNPTRRPY